MSQMYFAHSVRWRFNLIFIFPFDISSLLPKHNLLNTSFIPYRNTMFLGINVYIVQAIFEYPISLMYFSLLILKQCYLNYCSFIIHLDIRYSKFIFFILTLSWLFLIFTIQVEFRSKLQKIKKF